MDKYDKEENIIGQHKGSQTRAQLSDNSQGAIFSWPNHGRWELDLSIYYMNGYRNNHLTHQSTKRMLPQIKYAE